MATIITISQPSLAVFGTTTNFLLGIQNTGASAVTIQAMNVSCTGQSGQSSASARVAQPTIPVNATTQVDASATVYVPFSASFYGQALPSGKATANNNFILTGEVYFTDGTVSASVTFPVALASPIWGLVGSGPLPQEALVVPSLHFINPSNSGLHLLGWV